MAIFGSMSLTFTFSARLSDSHRFRNIAPINAKCKHFTYDVHPPMHLRHGMSEAVRLQPNRQTKPWSLFFIIILAPASTMPTCLKIATHIKRRRRKTNHFSPTKTVAKFLDVLSVFINFIVSYWRPDSEAASAYDRNG